MALEKIHVEILSTVDVSLLLHSEEDMDEILWGDLNINQTFQLVLNAVSWVCLLEVCPLEYSHPVLSNAGVYAE